MSKVFRHKSSQTMNVINLHLPDNITNPFIFCSPHSGRHYFDELLDRAVTSIKVLRRSEDAYIDQLFSSVPSLGSPFIEALFPRALIDPNRARNELDPDMFNAPIQIGFNRLTYRASAGLGVIPRIDTTGQALYKNQFTPDVAEHLLQRYYDPYHSAITKQIQDTKALFGMAVIIDCHSMPSAGARGNDIVLGDRYGVSCPRWLTSKLEHQFRQSGYTVSRNRPYAGGFTTEHYGQPHNGVHAIQIEINRALYLDEIKISPNSGFNTLQASINQKMKELVETDFQPKYAAE